MSRTFCIKDNCHYLERKRIAYYRCADCGCECLLTTPQGELRVLKGGVVTREMAARVLEALNLKIDLADRIK